MSEETRFLSIEERLQTEARRMVATDCQQAATQLWSEHLRRRRQRTLQKGAVTIVAVFVAIVAGAKYGWRDAAIERKPARPKQAMVANLQPRKPLAKGHHASPTPVPRQASPFTIQEDEKTLIAIPFVIDDPAGGKQIISGVYVPEQIEPIDLRQLSPAERDAVRAVLDIDDDLANGEVI